MFYQFEDVELIAETEKAILIRESGIIEDDVEQDINQWWVPISVVEGSDLAFVGDTGCVEVKTWWARKMELTDDEDN